MCTCVVLGHDLGQGSGQKPLPDNFPAEGLGVGEKRAPLDSERAKVSGFWSKCLCPVTSHPNSERIGPMSPTPSKTLRIFGDREAEKLCEATRVGLIPEG